MTQVAPRRPMVPPPPRRPRGKLRVLLLGGALITTGALLGLVPFLPGTPLVLLGVGLLSTHTVRGRWLRWRFRAWRRQRRSPPPGPQKAPHEAPVRADLPVSARVGSFSRRRPAQVS